MIRIVECPSIEEAIKFVQSLRLPVIKLTTNSMYGKMAVDKTRTMASPRTFTRYGKRWKSILVWWHNNIREKEDDFMQDEEIESAWMTEMVLILGTA